MKDIDPDTMVIVTGAVISLLALSEIYSSWKNC